MAYLNVNGTNGNNNLLFTGITGFYSETLVNPYSGYTVTITGTKNVNNGIYDGLAGTDTLLMTAQGDVLTLADTSGTIMIKNVEAITAGDGGDIIIMAHSTFTYGNITLRGSDGDDILWSNSGSDTLLGGFGNDILDGGAGDDRLYGDEGDDYLEGGLGADALFGGEGNDIFGYVADSIWSGGYTLASLGSTAGYAALVNLDGKNRSHDTFNGDATNSLVVPTVGTDRLVMTSGNDVLVLSDTISPVNSTFFLPRTSYIEIYEAGAGDDVIDLSGDAHIATTIYGGTGNDALAGSTGNDTIYGEADNDLISGGGGNDTLHGGTGNDAYYYKLGDGSDTIIEESGNDSIHFGPGITLSTIALSVSGNDVLISIGADTIRIQNHFAADLSGRVESIVFNDGSTFDLASYGLNEAPVANDDHFTGDEDTVISGNVLANDMDPDGDTLTVTSGSFTTALGGTVVLNADGSFTYQGASNFHGNDSFTYEIRDTSGESSSATVNLTVASVNDTPVAGNDAFSGNEDEEITGNVLLNDSDVEGDMLVVQSGTYATAQGGSVTINADGSFSYIGATNFNGLDSFDYTITDGNGGMSMASVSLTVGAVNDAPVAVNDAFSGNEDEEITGNVLLNDSDVDGDILNVQAGTYTTAQGGSVTINADGSFSYLGTTNFTGADSFEYTVTDANGGTDIGRVDLTVGAVNDAPIAFDDDFAGDEDTEITGNLLSNDTDTDGDILTAQAGTYATAQGGTVTINADGSFSYLGAANFNGLDSFEYTVMDGNGGTDTASVNLTVNAVNDVPTAVDDNFSGDEDTEITGNVLFNDSDIDGDVISVQPGTYTTAQGGTVSITVDGFFSYTGPTNFSGADSFDYTITDNSGTSTGRVNLTIGEVNDAPVANDDSYDGDEDAPVTGNVLDNDTDVDGDTLIVTAQTIVTAQGGTVTINADGTFTYTGAANFHGTDSFDYTVEDGRGGSDIGSVTLNIAAVNNAPVAVDDAFSGNEDEVITGNVLDNDTDVDGDILSVNAGAYTTALGGSVTINTDGSFSYQGALNFNGADSFDYYVADGNGGFSTARVNLTVGAVNDGPVAVDDSFAGSEDSIITGNVLGNDTDIDGDTLVVDAQTITTAQGGTVILNADGSFSYQGAANFNGSDSFSYTVLDAAGASASANVLLSVAAVNDAPVAVNDAFSGNEGQIVSGNVLSNDGDIDGDTLSVITGSFTTGLGGAVTLNADGTFTYQGAANFNGSDFFDYTVSDGNGGFDTARVDLSIGAVNDAPVAHDDNFTGNEDQPITGNVLANDTDVDGDTLVINAQTIVTSQGGTVTMSADGSFTYQGAANFHGNDSFSYTVYDPSGAASMANVLLSVASVNDAPVANNDGFNGFRNEAIAGNVLVNDTDVDGDTLSVQAGTFATAQGGTIELNVDGTFTYTPAPNFYGADSFDYTVLDGEGGTDLGTVSFTVDLDPSQSIIGTNNGETITGTNGDDQIFGLGGDDILYGDDGILTGITKDKVFADTIIMPELKEGVNISNLRPKGDPALGIADGNLTVDYDATASVTFRKGYAGYDNSFGVFGVSADGTIVNASMEWANVKTAGLNVSHDIDLPVSTDGGAFGFFIIADGNNTNSGYTGLNITGDGVLSFVYNYGKVDQRAAKITDPGAKVSIIYSDGVTTKVLKGDAYFTTERGDSVAINKDGKTHVVSGLMDTNDKYLDVKTADLASKPNSFTKNDYTITASSGQLIGNNNRIGIKSTAAGGDIIAGNEALHIALAHGASKLTVSLSDIAGGNTGIDFKIFLNGSTAAVSYEYLTGSVSGGKIDIVLNADDFGGGVITKIELSSVANSSKGTETFWLDNLYAEIPGGTDTNTLRIGFEDLYNTGDADYEDVLFDLDIKPITISDIGGGNDFLDGGAGNDVLYGEGGNDILVIGLGLDRAYGGEGADTFAITLIDQFVDRIEDFNLAQGDKINIADVLDSYDPLTSDIAAFVRLVQVGANSELQINADGAGNDFLAAALIIGGTGGADLNALISSGALVADQSAVA